MDIIAETSKRIEELERENRELREKLEECKELLRAVVDNIKYVEQRFDCCGCDGNWKSCPFNGGEKDVCTAHWVHAEEVEGVLKC